MQRECSWLIAGFPMQHELLMLVHEAAHRLAQNVSVTLQISAQLFSEQIQQPSCTCVCSLRAKLVFGPRHSRNLNSKSQHILYSRPCAGCR